MLIVDRHALITVNLLDFIDQVRLRIADALDVEDFLGVERAFVERVSGLDLGTVTNVGRQFGIDTNGVGDFRAVVANDDDFTRLGIFFTHPDDSGVGDKDRLTLRRTSFEELNHSGEAGSNVARLTLTGGNTTGVEGTHRELRSGLTD